MIVAEGGTAVGRQCDVSDPQAARQAVTGVQDDFGGIDVLVNNAAWFPPRAPLAEVPEQTWEKCLAVNVTGPFLMSRFAIPVMARGGGGSIIHIASQMARVANCGQTPYCTAKGALLMLAKGIALDHAADNIRCNTLSPGGIATPSMGEVHGSLENAERVRQPAEAGCHQRWERAGLAARHVQPGLRKTRSGSVGCAPAASTAYNRLVPHEAWRRGAMTVERCPHRRLPSGR